MSNKLANLLDLVHCKTCDKYVVLHPSDNRNLEILTCINEIGDIMNIEQYHNLYCIKCQKYSQHTFRRIGIKIMCSNCIEDIT